MGSARSSGLGVCAVVRIERRPGRGEADDGVSGGRDDEASVRRAGGEGVRPESFSVRDGQVGEDVLGEETAVGGAPGLHEHDGDGIGVGRRCVAELDHAADASIGEGPPSCERVASMPPTPASSTGSTSERTERTGGTAFRHARRYASDGLVRREGQRGGCAFQMSRSVLFLAKLLITARLTCSRSNVALRR